MSKIKRFSAVFLLIVMLCGYWFFDVVTNNWDDVAAIVDGFRYTPDEIENIRIETQKIIDKELSKYPDMHFRNLTEEEIAAISKGIIDRSDIPYLVTDRKVFKLGKVMTAEEYKAYLEEQENKDKNPSGKKDPVSDEKQDNPPDKKPVENIAQPPASKNAKLEAVLEKFFVLKANFLADIEGYVDAMIAEYKALPKEQRTKATRSQYAERAISVMKETEPRYDAQFESILNELKAVVEETNADASIIESVQTTYRKEKASIKAKYVSRARKHL